jgi:hypothetical protein
MRSLKSFIAQQSKAFPGKIAIGLRWYNAEPVLKLDGVQLLLERFNALKKDYKAALKSGKIGVELIL